MTDEQKAAYVHAQAVACQCEMEGMKARNQDRDARGLVQAYNEVAFGDLIDRYGLGSNTVLGLFHGVPEYGG